MSSQVASKDFGYGETRLSSIPIPKIKGNSLRLVMLSDAPGVIEIPGARSTRVSIHIGPSVQVACRRAGRSHRGIVVHGDIEIIPADTPSVWEITERDTFLAMSISPDLMNAVAEQLDFDPQRIEIRNRFQVRDQQLENIAWALKAEMEAGYPCGRLYLDSLAVAAATRLLLFHSSASREPKQLQGRLSERRLRQVLSYIEDNLSQDVSLHDIAGVAGLSVSHFKSLFRETLGLPVHQYLIRRRVERAKTLLREDKLPISQIAFETGFAHQSHLAHHMRRVLGVSPKAFREMSR
jgi:AraC family transcriptional regulator